MSTSASRMPLVSLRLPRLGDDRLAALAAAGDERAFEALYDRHHRPLLAFCRHMLGTREEAEDALQQTYLRAHRALLARGAPAELRPWLFTIARNCCLTMLSARRPVADDETALASTEGLGEQVQTRADLRAVVADVERLPDDQRAALVLAELADLSHEQIAEVIGVRTGKVKALIHQARTTLIAERDARDTPCAEVREELATARGGALRRGPLRRHLRLCDGCRAYRVAVEDQRRALALVLPVTPSLGLKAGILGAASATGGAGAAAGGAAAGGAAAGGAAAGGAGAGTAGLGGATVGGGLAAKLVATAIVAGGTAAGGVAVVDHSGPDPLRAPVATRAPAATPTARALTPAAATTSPVAVRNRLSRPAATPAGSSPGQSLPAGSGGSTAAGPGHGAAQGPTDGQRQAGDQGSPGGQGQGQGQGQQDPSADPGRPASRPEPKDRQDAAAKAKERPASSIPPGQAKKHAAAGPKPRPPAAAKPERAPMEKAKSPGARPQPSPTAVPTAQPTPERPGKRDKSDKSEGDTTGG
jgi:RNA polymerase sigma factor (sigma-70 family)